MASVASISAPFLPISYLCAIVSSYLCAMVSFLVTDTFDLGYFIITAQWKLILAITFTSEPLMMAQID